MSLPRRPGPRGHCACRLGGDRLGWEQLELARGASWWERSFSLALLAGLMPRTPIGRGAGGAGRRGSPRIAAGLAAGRRRHGRGRCRDSTHEPRASDRQPFGDDCWASAGADPRWRRDRGRDPDRHGRRRHRPRPGACATSGTSYTEDRAAIRLEGVRGCVIEDNRSRGDVLRHLRRRGRPTASSPATARGTGRRPDHLGNGIHLFTSRRIHRRAQPDPRPPRRHLPRVLRPRDRSSATRATTTSATVSTSCSPTAATYRGNAFTDNGAGVAVMYSRARGHDRQPFRGQLGAGRRTACCSRRSPTAGSSGNRFSGNTVGLFAEGIGPHRDRRQPVPRQRLGGRAHGQRDRQHFRGTGSRATASTWRPTAAAAAPAPSRRTSGTSTTGYDLDRDGWATFPTAPVRLFSVLVEQNEPAHHAAAEHLGRPARPRRAGAPVLTPGDAWWISSPLMAWSASCDRTARACARR